jgi:glycosyltransferase involved in cell wall biosynthesis
LKSKGVTHILLLGWNVRAFIEVALISWRCGIKLWLRAEGNDLKINSYFKQKIKNLFLKLYFNNIDKFLTIGKANRRLYESFGVGEDRLYSAPYCVENKRFAEQAHENIRNRDKLRKSWHIDAESFCVLFVGKFMHKKHPGDIIRAIKILQKRDIRRRYHVLYVGTGELGTDLREKSNVIFDGEEQIDNHYGNQDLPMASFTGFVNQSKISEVYVVADLLVLPSEADETWGLVTNEAMASGLPCVVSDACGSSEDLAAAVDPILRFPLGNIEFLANSIQYVADNPPSKTLIKKVIDQYDFIYTVDTLERLCNENKVN